MVLNSNHFRFHMGKMKWENWKNTLECSEKIENWVFWVQVILKGGLLAKIESKIKGRYLVDILERHWKNSTINESTTTTWMKWYKYETTNNMRFEKVININHIFYNLRNGTVGSLVTSKHENIYIIVEIFSTRICKKWFYRQW